MFSDKMKAKIIGVLFIVAAVTAIIGLLLYDPILNNPDYLTTGAENGNNIIWGAIFELILAVSAVGTAVMMFPYLKLQDESLALAHVCFRFFEAVIITIGVISVLTLLSLSRDFVNATSPDVSVYETSGGVLKAIHSWTFILGPNFMLGINTFLYNYLFYKSGLVPTKLAVLGLTAASLVFTAAILEMFDAILQISAWGAILSFPQFIYEMTLAVWLIVKGFNLSKVS